MNYDYEYENVETQVECIGADLHAPLLNHYHTRHAAQRGAVALTNRESRNHEAFETERKDKKVRTRQRDS